VGVYVSTFGTGVVPDEKLARWIQRKFDMRPRRIIEQLDLLRPVYRATASYGHFGRSEESFTWERTDRAAEMAAALLPRAAKAKPKSNGAPARADGAKARSNGAGARKPARSAGTRRASARA
jgi:S-adenosylmethionine synthetase